MSLTAAFLLFAASGTANSNLADLGPEPEARLMSPSEIRASNAKFTRGHPYYIRCQSREETGSLAKRIRSCRTNHQWKLAFDVGNQNARDTMDAMTSKAADGQH